MKIPVLLLFVLVFASCSGYFQENDGLSGDQVSRLALADGSGYLSTDNYNEITPFLFRDKDYVKAYLFFSSDRNGSYDIYFAELNKSGTFGTPVKMAFPVNDPTNHEYSPVLFYSAFSGSTNIYITFISRSQNNSATNIITWPLNSSFMTNDYVQDNFSANVLGLGFEALPTNIVDSGRLVVSYGNTNIHFFKKGSQNTEFAWGIMFFGDSRTNYSVFQAGSRKAVLANAYYHVIDNTRYLIIQSSLNQIWGSTIAGVSTNLFDIPAYSSSYNDRDPFIDWGGTLWPVYFSSDRLGKGNYDLYRYNTKTYWVVTR